MSKLSGVQHFFVMSKKISNVALLTFEGAAFNVTFLALLLILVYPLTLVLKQQ
jgi:hypothetical protein